MDLLRMADPSLVLADALTGLANAIIRILAFGAMGIVVVGFVMACLCDVVECHKLRRRHGRTEACQLMH